MVPIISLFSLIIASVNETENSLCVCNNFVRVVHHHSFCDVYLSSESFMSHWYLICSSLNSEPSSHIVTVISFIEFITLSVLLSIVMILKYF